MYDQLFSNTKRYMINLWNSCCKSQNTWLRTYDIIRKISYDFFAICFSYSIRTVCVPCGVRVLAWCEWIECFSFVLVFLFFVAYSLRFWLTYLAFVVFARCFFLFVSFQFIFVVFFCSLFVTVAWNNRNGIANANQYQQNREEEKRRKKKQEYTWLWRDLDITNEKFFFCICVCVWLCVCHDFAAPFYDS